MNCDCGNRAFFFEKISTEGTLRVFKCDYDVKKKTRCTFLHTEKIKEPVIINSKKTPIEPIVENKVNTRGDYIKTLKSHINLFKNSCHLPRELNVIHSANINHILNKLNMPLFFENQETLINLEKRIDSNVQNVKIEHINIFPLKLVDYPENLSVPKKIKRVKKVNKRSRINTNVDLGYFIRKDEDSEADDSDKSSVSDESEKSDTFNDDNDNTFDVESYNSGEDVEDDAGAFSD